MAQYTITTIPAQEDGLTYAFEHRRTNEATQAEFLQAQVDHMVLNPMVTQLTLATAIALDKSVATVPKASEEKFKTELAALIVANGGQLVPAGPPPDPLKFAQTAARIEEFKSMQARQRADNPDYPLPPDAPPIVNPLPPFPVVPPPEDK